MCSLQHSTSGLGGREKIHPCDCQHYTAFDKHSAYQIWLWHVPIHRTKPCSSTADKEHYSNVFLPVLHLYSNVGKTKRHKGRDSVAAMTASNGRGQKPRESLALNR